MIIYKDLVSGDEIISDSYNLKDIDDVVYEVDCKMIKTGDDNFDIGANPSAEEAEEGVEDSSKQVNDVVHSFRLNYLGDEATGSRLYGTTKDYMSQFKSETFRVRVGLD
ncbi:MAG: hypothetical protein LQ340_007577 [Diploschistes diacapsis]|nr:MAG: hypothetical protein LQ340_007577 [Diploschistes diacapsis]